MLLGMLPWVLTSPRRAALPGLAGAAIVAFGLLGFRLGLGRWVAGAGPTVRVLESNAGGGASVAELIRQIRDSRADIVVVAECGGALFDALKAIPGFDARSNGYLCLGTRFTIRTWENRDPTKIWQEGGSGAIVRAILDGPTGPLRLGLVHLETPRNALSEFLDLSEIPKLGALTRDNLRQRQEESQDARAWVAPDDSLPTIVAGDFNLPVESAIYRENWGNLRNAFSRAGLGTGYTKHTRLWGVRIDHILTSGDIGSRRCVVGDDIHGDHRPVIADLVLPADQRTSATR
jgi:endonuclease/exonuclease/phosphatase family metal-dependent hydrolase